MRAGFGKSAAEKLEELKSHLTGADLADACWALANWYRSNGDYRRALDHLLIGRMADPNIANESRHTVVEADILLKLNRPHEANSAIARAMQQSGEVPELCFCAANVAPHLTHDAPAANGLRLSWLNKPLVAAGLAPIALKDPSAPLSIDNITAVAPPHPRSGEAKISVLMPAYNAEDTVATAIASVIDQTWANLELLVVDDGSTDKTWSIIENVARRDTRVKPLRHGRNLGAYAARNTGLRHATGNLVTVHDADDWSHPEKLALQAVGLLEGRLAANATKQSRVDPGMYIHVQADGAMIVDCHPSLMMTKEVMLALGGWDECRMGADNELWKRLLAKHRQDAWVICASVPLGLPLLRANSLTSDDHTGVRTLYSGARRQYVEAFRYWHETERAKAAPDWVVRPGLRRFPIPAICQPAPMKPLSYDVLFVSDFSILGPVSRNINALQKAHELGLRCACFHWPRLDSAGHDVDREIRKLLHEGIADNVVAGEGLACGLVVVGDEGILDHLPDELPVVRSEACHIIEARGARRAEARAMNAESAFDIVPQWVPEAKVKQMLSALRADHARKSPAETRTEPRESSLARP